MTLLRGTQMTTPHHSLTILGDVQHVLMGDCSSQNTARISTNCLAFGIGCSSVTGMEGLGETLILGHHGHVCWAQQGRLTTASGEDLLTPFLVGVEQDSPACCEALLEQLSLEALYAKLGARFPSGFAIVGYVTMAQLNATYVKKPPIFHEEIDAHQDQYWAPVSEIRQQPVIFFGVVIPPTGQALYSPQQLQHAFYHNPAETTSTPYLSHTHGALVSAPPDLTNASSWRDELHNLSVQGVRHILTSSILQTGWLAYYPFDHLIRRSLP